MTDTRDGGGAGAAGAGGAGSGPTANDRMKAGFGGMFWYSVAAAAVLHLAVGRMEELVGVELPPEVVIPPAPEQIVRPAHR
jgi:hypothetical protein